MHWLQIIGVIFILFTPEHSIPMSQYYAHPSACIEDGASIGKNAKVWHFCHIRKDASIGDNCNLGKDVFVDAGVRIGNNVKIQNGVSVYRGVTIEEDVFLGPHMTFTNDLFPRAFADTWEEVPTLVKKGASIGANATIICGITLGAYCMVGSGSVVTRDVPDHGLVVGNPAKLRGFVCTCGQKAEFESETEGDVTLQCKRCKERISIPKNIYILSIKN